MEKKAIVITGATGLIGTHLVGRIKDDYRLILLTRNPQRYTSTDCITYTYWDGKSAIPDTISSCYAVVNLVGENIGRKKWTVTQKKKIINSRKDAAEAILKSIEQCENKPQVWIQASASGYYEQSSIAPLDETAPKAKDSFLADVCQAWEKPINYLLNDSIRKVVVRTGVVLASNSDLWKQLTMPFKFGVAAIPGSGKQHLPWVHIDDEVNVLVEALNNNSYEGVFNLVSPLSCTMSELVHRISLHKKKIVSIKIPAWFLKLLFGKEMTREIVLTDQNIVPAHLIQSNYQFRFRLIDDAVTDLLKK